MTYYTLTLTNDKLEVCNVTGLGNRGGGTLGWLVQRAIKGNASTVWELLFCLTTESLSFQHSGSPIELHVGSINTRQRLS